MARPHPGLRSALSLTALARPTLPFQGRDDAYALRPMRVAQSIPAHREIGAMDHLGAAGVAWARQDIARLAALDLLGIVHVECDQPASDLVTVGAAHDHGVAAAEASVDADHAGGQQAAPHAQGRDSACVDD